MFCAVIVDFFRCERRYQDNGQKLAPGGLGGVSKGLGGGSREELTPRSNILN